LTIGFFNRRCEIPWVGVSRSGGISPRKLFFERIIILSPSKESRRIVKKAKFLTILRLDLRPRDSDQRVPQVKTRGFLGSGISTYLSY